MTPGLPWYANPDPAVTAPTPKRGECPAGGRHRYVHHHAEPDTNTPGGAWCDECGATPYKGATYQVTPTTRLGAWEARMWPVGVAEPPAEPEPW